LKSFEIPVKKPLGLRQVAVDGLKILFVNSHGELQLEHTQTQEVELKIVSLNGAWDETISVTLNESWIVVWNAGVVYFYPRYAKRNYTYKPPLQGQLQIATSLISVNLIDESRLVMTSCMCPASNSSP